MTPPSDGKATAERLSAAAVAMEAARARLDAAREAHAMAESAYGEACAAHAAALNDLFMLIGHAKVEPPPPPGGVGMAPDFLGRIKEGSMQHKVLKHMADGASRDWDAHEIADTTGVPILRVRSILSKLFAAERIARTSGGRYRIKS